MPFWVLSFDFYAVKVFEKRGSFIRNFSCLCNRSIHVFVMMFSFKNKKQLKMNFFAKLSKWFCLGLCEQAWADP